MNSLANIVLLLMICNIKTNQPTLYHIQLVKIERTIPEQKQFFQFLTTSQNYFVDEEDDPILSTVLDWQPSTDQKTEQEDQSIKYSPQYQLSQDDDSTTSTQKLKPTSSNNQGKINLKNFKNTQYLGEIQVGSNLDTFTVIYDTGSANMWINSKRCKDPGCLNHQQFDPFNSKTYNEMGFDLDVEFGTGSLKGFMGKDQIQIGGVSVSQQDFAEIVKEEGAVFQASKFDGIVGLAYPQMAAYGLNPVFDNIIKEKKLESNIFSFVLDRTEGGVASELVLGGVDANSFEGNIQWHKVVDKYYWMIKADKILLDGKDTELCNNCNVIADTGTSLITGPTNELMNLLDNIQVDDYCKNVKSLPVLTFVIDGINYELTPHDYLMKVDENNNEEPYAINTQNNKKGFLSFLSFNNNNENERCTGAFMPLDIPEPQGFIIFIVFSSKIGPAWILGDIFLSKYVSAYDRDKNLVGFAKAKNKK